MHRPAIFLQAMVWLVNGLYCKVLGLVPRHEAIVARILGPENAVVLTQLIGFGEILLSLWIASLIRPRLALIVQIVLVATMNLIEALLAPDLLLFGYGNTALAAAFIALLAFVYRTVPANTPRS